MSSNDISNVAPPALPQATKQYDRGYTENFNNILRLYFNRLDSSLRRVVAGMRVSVKSYTAVSEAYTVLTTDFTIECTSGTFAVTLPSAVGITGQEFVVKNSGAGTVTVTPDGSETIDGAATAPLAQYNVVKIMSTGQNWIVV